MSVLPNAVYANPTTPCWESDTSGGGLNPIFDTVTFNVPSGGILSERIALGEDVFSGQSQVAIFNANANTLGPLQVGGTVEVQGGSSLPSAGEERMFYTSDSIVYQEATTGTSRVILEKTASPPPSKFALTNIASINGNPVLLTQYDTIATSGASGSQAVTLPTAYSNTSYAVMATMQDTTPAQMSVAITANNAFTVYWSNGGAGSHSIAWLAVGV